MVSQLTPTPIQYLLVQGIDVQPKTLAPDSDNFYDSLIIQCPDGRDVCYSLRSEEELTLKSTRFMFAFLFESAHLSYLVASFLLKLRKQGLTGLLLTLALQRQYCLHLSPTQGLGLSFERISCISRYENRSCILSYRNVNRDASGWEFGFLLAKAGLFSAN
jgi:hypothetical protein